MLLLLVGVTCDVRLWHAFREEGRARVDKFQVRYKFVGEGPPGRGGAVTLRYLPLYGDLPGYTVRRHDEPSAAR